MEHPLPSSLMSVYVKSTAVPTRFNKLNVSRDAREVRLHDGYEPQPFDVLCAKGKEISTHVGNNRFRVCVEMCLDRYVATTTRNDKTVIIREILDAVHAKGGRFLRREPASTNHPNNEHDDNKDNNQGKLNHKRQEADVPEAVQFVYFVVSTKREMDKTGKAIRAALQQRTKKKRRNSWTANGSGYAESATGNSDSPVAAAPTPSRTLFQDDHDFHDIEPFPLCFARMEQAEEDRGWDDDDDDDGMGWRQTNHYIMDARPTLISRRNSWHAELHYLEANKASDSTGGHDGLSTASDCTLSSQAWDMNDFEEEAEAEEIGGTF